MGVARVKIGGRVTRVRAPRQGSIVVLIIAVLLCLVCVGGVLLNKQRLIKKEREYTKQKNAMYEENYGAGASHRHAHGRYHVEPVETVPRSLAVPDFPFEQEIEGPVAFQPVNPMGADRVYTAVSGAATPGTTSEVDPAQRLRPGGPVAARPRTE